MVNRFLDSRIAKLGGIVLSVTLLVLSFVMWVWFIALCVNIARGWDWL